MNEPKDKTLLNTVHHDPKSGAFLCLLSASSLLANPEAAKELKELLERQTEKQSKAKNI